MAGNSDRYIISEVDMKIINTYSFKGGEDYIQNKYPNELGEIVRTIDLLYATRFLSKIRSEKTMKGKLLFSPRDLNHFLKMSLYALGWTQRAKGKRKAYVEPRHSFGEGRFREMDGMKNKVGLEIQFGKYAFMGYDIFSKMVIFKNLGYIDCGIEIVPSHDLVKQMSTGVSSFEQLLIDFKHRGESNIDIPVFVIGIGLTDTERDSMKELQELFSSKRTEALKLIRLRRHKGALPGPKK